MLGALTAKTSEVGPRNKACLRAAKRYRRAGSWGENNVVEGKTREGVVDGPPDDMTPL